MPYKNQPITTGRIKTLHVCANNVIKATGVWNNMEELKQDWLYPTYKVTSTKELTIAQADEAIQALRDMIGDNKARITYPQSQKIYALQALLAMPKEHLWNFMLRQLGGRRSVSMLTKQEASKVIVGLQRIFCAGDQKLYNKLNQASARYLRSTAGKEELQLMRKKTKALKSIDYA